MRTILAILEKLALRKTSSERYHYKNGALKVICICLALTTPLLISTRTYLNIWYDYAKNFITKPLCKWMSLRIALWSIEWIIQHLVLWWWHTSLIECLLDAKRFFLLVSLSALAAYQIVGALWYFDLSQVTRRRLSRLFLFSWPLRSNIQEF